MSDFIIQIGEMQSPEHVARRLQDRPGMKDRPVVVKRFKWGSAAIQPPPGRGYQPVESNRGVFACTGRPRMIGLAHEDDGDDGFCRAVARALENHTLSEMPASLTGMFVLAILDSEGFRIVTDLLGSQPVYQARGKGNESFCVGTNADIVAEVAEVAGHVGDLDLVSIGEFLVYDQISFPFTTYRQLTELDPASVSEWNCSGAAIRTSAGVYWEPREPKVWPGRNEIMDELESALRLGAEEISRGSRHLAVTLSGGRDSRTVLALLRNRGVAAALTYCTRDNRETEVAAQVAKAAGVPHVLVRREPHFYGKLLERTMALVGSEVRAVGHGFAILDAGLAEQFDVVVGGYLSDTLLKDHFMPPAQLDRLRKKSLRERLSTMLRSRTSQKSTNARWAASPELLGQDIREQVLLRRSKRLARIAEVRPRSAEEWQGFWPISRQHDVGSAWANSRLFCSDELFYFRRVIEVAARLAPSDRYAGIVAHAAFNRLCGPLNAMMNANTGVAASADDREEGSYFKKLRKTGQLEEFRTLPASAAPWNDVQHSWADPVKLLAYSPDWKRYRQGLLHSRAVEILNSILSPENHDMFSVYTPGQDPRAGMALIQMGLHIGNDHSCL